ncbi:DNA polymerase/3'-5' exonuclease PolX [Macrococcus brunensis]|uniref:DNA-directed DNA polymerase n=1 Tax=Macrococcus brunensis TaxID=198483 RepID=A0A4V3BDB5_9STAP|nr:DNA polymerase/3'-5' exonuclease PolX [Macrococcus brunensis]TDL96735.1 DNA polymerase/3'-5' exonuclease PolX [Macrococcus brunensis]ULG73570.1 DNA polymerase/3'-5' exonuclease PolX [Macrococcus brunensis]
MTKKDYIKLLETIGLYMELKGENTFKVSAYRKAAAALEQSQVPIDELADFTVLPGIGKGVSEVLNEYRATGESSLLEELKEAVPAGHIQMLKIRNLGAKKIVKLYKELNITTIDELKAACESHAVSGLTGFGKKTEETILQGIQDLETKKEHITIHEAVKLTGFINQTLEEAAHVKRFAVAGSHRRMKELSKDLDYIVVTDDALAAAKEIEAFTFIQHIEVSGQEKVSVTVKMDDLESGVDFRFTDDKGFVQMLNHFTGSKEHNVKMRQLAKARDEKVNEYGITLADGTLKQYDSEEAIYKHYQLNYIPPEMRDDVTAFEVEQSEILKLSDIRGDLHMHTTASDGAFELEEMIEACIQKGYDYMAITDHSRSLKVANGLSVERLLAQNQKIKELNQAYSEIDIYSGIEMDILPDGTLDYADDVLKELDYVIAAIHQSFNQSEEETMQRLINACQNPYVRQIAHPTGRLIGRRSGYAVNMAELIEVAGQTNTVLEINANPMRLDLSAEVIRQYPDIKLAINTDAHHTSHLEFMKYGVGTAIKGHVKREQVLNTLTREAFHDWLQKGKTT